MQLHLATGFSSQKIKEIMAKGAVWLSRPDSRQPSRIRRVKKTVTPGMTLHLYFDDTVLRQEPAGARLIADESAYSIWYKPYGMYSQGTRWGDHCTVYRWVEQHLNPQRAAYTVHRLDRAANGLMIIAHRKRIAAAFTGMFEKRVIEKRYRAIVHGQIPDAATSIPIRTEIDGRSAVSHVQSLQFQPQLKRTLVEVLIETGRKHQIRRHLAEIGYPIVGDRLYSNREDPEDLQLSAHYLSFPCPVSKIRQEYTVPKELVLAMKSASVE